MRLAALVWLVALGLSPSCSHKSCEQFVRADAATLDLTLTATSGQPDVTIRVGDRLRVTVKSASRFGSLKRTGPLAIALCRQTVLHGPVDDVYRYVGATPGTTGMIAEMKGISNPRLAHPLLFVRVAVVAR